MPGSGIGGHGGGGSMTGMSEQEAAMVKAVSQKLHDKDVSDGFSMLDARCHGKLPFQNRYIRRNGICSWRSLWSVHVKRTKCRS